MCQAAHDTQSPTNKTIDISLNTLKTATNTAGHYPRNNGTNYVDAAIAGADLPATTSNCSGVQLAIGLNAGMTPVCATPPTFVASGASHAVGYVPDPGAGAGTTKFLREDATWVAPAGGVSQMIWNGRGSVSITTVCNDTNNDADCQETVFSQTHTLVRLTYRLITSPAGCTTIGVIGLRDQTSAANVQTFTVSNGTGTGFQDSGAISVAMTAGDKFSLGTITAAAGCSTFPTIQSLSAVIQ